jgi:FO synthase
MHARSASSSESIGRILRQTEPLSETAIRTLLDAPEEFDDRIAAAADALARMRCGDAVTYVVNRNINFTNKCNIRCHFCAFHRPDSSPEQFTLSVGDCVAALLETPSVTEVCIQGGIHDNLGLDYYEEMVRQLKAVRPDVHIHAFSPQEIQALAMRENIDEWGILTRLKQAGLDSMPGTAAEILVPHVRKAVSPRRLTVGEWTHIVVTAHQLGIRTSATAMVGHVESSEDFADHLLQIRDIQTQTGGFTEFVPMPFMPAETALKRADKVKEAMTFRRYRRIVAVSRLALDPLILNIQVSWPKVGLHSASSLLRAGANDLGGTLYQESITRAAGGAHGEYQSPEAFRSAAKEAGLWAVQRTTLYGQRAAVA